MSENMPERSKLPKDCLRLTGPVLIVLLGLFLALGACTPTNPYKDSIVFMNDATLDKEVAILKDSFETSRSDYHRAKASNMNSDDVAVLEQRYNFAKTRLKYALREQIKRGNIKPPTWIQPSLDSKEYGG